MTSQSIAALPRLMGEDVLTSVPITEGEAFKRGFQYEAANRVKIPNMGQKKFPVVMENGVA